MLDSEDLVILSGSKLPDPLVMKVADQQIEQLDSRWASVKGRVDRLKAECSKLEEQLPSSPRSGISNWLRGRIPLFNDSDDEDTRTRLHELTQRLEGAEADLKSIETVLHQEFSSLYPSFSSRQKDLPTYRSLHDAARVQVFGANNEHLKQAEQRARLEAQEAANRRTVAAAVTRLVEAANEERVAMSEEVTHVVFGGTRLRKRTST